MASSTVGLWEAWMVIGWDKRFHFRRSNSHIRLRHNRRLDRSPNRTYRSPMGSTQKADSNTDQELEGSKAVQEWKEPHLEDCSYEIESLSRPALTQSQKE